MHCPACQTTLQMTERQGVEIDYCPTCRGVWLDRGELDKIIDRVAAAAPAAPAARRDYSDERRRHDAADDYARRGDRYYERADDYRKRKRRGLLGELFDFD
ncbi:MAG TPA: zf-TFIIB domain-containing protein [Chloroflexota bacterium]|nr:zf-TFIIB domain-containing protein [Chloroflexota bacterium]